MDGLNYTIEVDDLPARQATDRVNKSFDTVGKQAVSSTAVASGAFASLTAGIIANGKTIEQAFVGAGHAVAGFGAFVLKAAEAAVAVVGAYSLAAGAIARYGASTTEAASFTDQLVSSFRVLRLTASAALPEVFGSIALAGTTVGLSILVEETIRLVNARAQLIEQQSLVAAIKEIPFQAVSRNDFISRAAGLDRNSVRDLYSVLDKRIDSDQSTVRGGLATLGVPSYLGKPGETIDPQLLTQIAQGFSSIEDPAKRAQAAVAIFGKDNAATALKELGPAFVDAAHSIDLYGVKLDNVSRNNIFAFRQDLLAIKEYFTDFSAFSAWGQKIGIVFESATAGAEQFTKKVLGITGTLISILDPSFQAANQFLNGPSDQEFKDQAAKILGGNLSNQQAATLAAAQKATSDDLVKQAYAEDSRRALTPEGIRASLSSAQSRRDAALKALRDDDVARAVDPKGKSVLSADARFATATQYSSAAQLANLLDAQVKAADEAKEVSKRQNEAFRSSQELVYRSAFEPGAGRDLRGEIQKATSFVDKDGDIQQIKLLDGTRRNLEAAFHTYALDLNRKASGEAVKEIEARYKQEEKFQDQLFTKRRQFDEESGTLELQIIDRTFAHQNTIAGYTRDERLGALAGTDPQTVAGKLALEQRKLGIEREFITTTSVNDADTIQRLKDRELINLAEKRVTGQIDDSEYFRRRKDIEDSAGQQGTALNDKFSHELLTAQQNAANASVQIVRDAQLKEFDSLKSSVEGVLQASETKGVSVFKAIGLAAKSALLGAFNEIISSQIAAALFRALNPGASVGFDGSVAGGKFGGFLGALGLGTKPVFGGAVPQGDHFRISDDGTDSAHASMAFPDVQIPLTGIMKVLSDLSRPFSNYEQPGLAGNISLPQSKGDLATSLLALLPFGKLGKLGKAASPAISEATVARQIANVTPAAAAESEFIGSSFVESKMAAALGVKPNATSKFGDVPIYLFDSADNIAGAQNNAGIFLNKRGSPADLLTTLIHEHTHSALSGSLGDIAAARPAKEFEQKIASALSRLNPAAYGQRPSTQTIYDEGLAYGIGDRSVPGLDARQSKSFIESILSQADKQGSDLRDRVNRLRSATADDFPFLNQITGGDRFRVGGDPQLTYRGTADLPDGLPISSPRNYGPPDGLFSSGGTDATGLPLSSAYGEESLGIPGGFGFPSAAGLGVPGIGGRGGIGSGLNLGNLKGLIYNSGEIQVGPGVASSAAGISQSLGGGILGSLAGGAAGFASSASGGTLGASLLLSGLQGPVSATGGVKTGVGGALLGANIGSKIPGLGITGGALVGGGIALGADGLRRGGVTGALETTAGGAAIGFQFGGPIGAAIGAGVGAAVGIARLFLGGDSDLKHTKDLVKQIYGFDLNDATANEIIQIAKQKYGGQISLAVRSQEVRDLLKLFAESIGSTAQKQFVNDTIHSASLIEAGGKLTQGAVYDNGAAYTYQSGLPTLNGISSSILPTVSRTSGSSNISVGNLSLSLNGQAASDVLAGQVVRTATPSYVQGQSIAAQRSSIGRSSATTLALAPSAIVQ
jgi:hypothetical protein